MSTALPVTIDDDSLTGVWGRAFCHAWDSREPAPMLLSLRLPPTGIPTEDGTVRATLSDVLARLKKVSPTENAELLFPWRSWERRASGTRKAFYDWYLQKMLPRLKARDRKNCFGTYFERMIAFPKTGGTVNQLEHILELWEERSSHNIRPRESALQVTIFNPSSDHTKGMMRGFPCLQQLSLAYAHRGKELSLTALYPCQYVFDRGYGNYLGLCHLGRYMAQGMGLSFRRLNCLVLKPQLGHKRKADLSGLHTAVSEFLRQRKAAA